MSAPAIITSHIDCLLHLMDELPAQLDCASQLILETILRDGKLLVCGTGNGGLAAELFCLGMINKLENERPALPAFLLSNGGNIVSGISHSYNANDCFARQISAIGSPADTLVIFSCDDHYQSLTSAIKAAQSRQMRTLVSCGNSNKNLTTLVQQDDVSINLDVQSTVQLTHIQFLIANVLCDVVEKALFGDF